MNTIFVTNICLHKIKALLPLFGLRQQRSIVARLSLSALRRGAKVFDCLSVRVSARLLSFLLGAIAPADCCSVGVEYGVVAKDSVAELSLVAIFLQRVVCKPSCIEFSKHFSNFH